MIRCPVCRAKNKDQPVCRRCCSDLSDLIQVEAQADRAMTTAVRYLRKGNIGQAQRFCTYACRLKRTEFSEVLSGFLNGLVVK